ncbi:hypothetical protein GCM10009584_26580 [Ornithinimicrobium humiphilum]|uniref:Uncharacterized protein n=1 Tax=Ornithinimicrobium humiphilum TaxID=125288 RepID=A0A543KPC6_9MICO|nr:hypothetical protein [Ornithinimicrobium humiphilum]TQM96923.1 hypothetical protein FB476_1817 [Ornithinimicrobium humiphilum]
MPHQELPAGVRVALWGTAALTGRLPLPDLPRRALPDIDECLGLVETVRVWGELGERTVLVALPRPGDVTGMPRGSADLVAHATRSEECVFVPALGGALVPDLEVFGPVGDQGWLSRWTRYDAEPVATHRLEALDLGHTELALRQQLAALTEELDRAGAPPFGDVAERGAARARAAAGTAGLWGLPDGLPPRALRVLQLAGTVLAIADAGLDTATASVDATSVTRRGTVLRQLQSTAARALADATNAAALHLAYRS